jgi:AI-2 transport protein TqsA
MGSEVEVTPSRQLPRWLVIVVGIAATLVAALGVREFASVLGPVFLALVLSIAVHPLRDLAARRRLPGWLGAIFSLIGVYAIVAGLFGILVIAGVQFAELAESYAPQFQAFVQQVGERLQALGVSQEKLQGIVNGLDPGKLVDVLTSLVGGIAGVLSNIFFLITLLFFTVSDAGSFAAKLGRISPRGQRLAEAFRLFARGTRQYLAVATIFGAIVAVCDVAALWILDIRYAWLWGLLAFITNYIPNIGFLIGVVPPTVIALLDKGVGTAIAVVVIYSVVNFVIQTIIQPRVVGTAVGLSSTLTFLSLIVWATILGATGALLAVPLTLFVKSLLIDVAPEHGWLTPLLSSGVEPPPSDLTSTEQAQATDTTGKDLSEAAPPEP